MFIILLPNLTSFLFKAVELEPYNLDHRDKLAANYINVKNFKAAQLQLKFILNEKNLGFVPTMGSIHKGHISLIKKSNFQCNKTVVTIFINKPQFNRKSDYQKYPRILGRDIKTLKKLNIDYLYIPSNKQIYPKGLNKKIRISIAYNLYYYSFKT